MTRGEREALERDISKRMHSAVRLHLCAGIGLAAMLDYITRHLKMSVCVSCEPIRQRGGLVTSVSHLVGIFNGYEQRGYAEGEDFYQTMTVAAGQAFGILPQVGGGQIRFRGGRPEHVTRQDSDKDAV